MRFRRITTLAFGLLFVGMGIALVVETALVGGGIGYLLGVLFAGAGAGRIYLLLRG